MRFNNHSDLEGLHAFLSASKSHWLGYDDEKMIRTLKTRQAAARGTELHEIAARLIRLGLKQARTKQTFNMYVNDALGYRMKPEQVLFYSVNCFGTADAISYRDGYLRIHDLKTGIGKTTFTQLEVYAALFCLEYGIRPGDLDDKIELRIYQNDKFVVHFPEIDRIAHIMDRIVHSDNLINQKRAEEAA